MPGIEMTPYDKKIYSEYLADFLPESMIDVHVHVWKEEFALSLEVKNGAQWPKLVASECTPENLAYIYERLFPGKTVMPVLMGHPAADLSETNAYAAECGKKSGLPTMFCTSCTTPAQEVRRVLESGGFAGIKPYLSNALEYIPPNEIRIYDFLPHEHLKIADELGKAVMLHIARPSRLKDPVNVAQMMEIDERYPNAKVIIAHIGRAYIEEDIGNAFETLKNSKNLLFDFSANTLDKAMIACIGAVGAKRVMFGSDMPITKMRMYRIAEGGIYKNVVPRGLYGDVSNDKNMKETDGENITFFIYEQLMAFRRAAEALKLAKSEIFDIFCGNAAKLFDCQPKMPNLRKIIKNKNAF
ncbi:MAG: amidohydrolase [Oscillospiraceae bacterium]|nr:amidohydrolase [Oscillospiraceae bacterium]